MRYWKSARQHAGAWLTLPLISEHFHSRSFALWNSIKKTCLWVLFSPYSDTPQGSVTRSAQWKTKQKSTETWAYCMSHVLIWRDTFALGAHFFTLKSLVFHSSLVHNCAVYCTPQELSYDVSPKCRGLDQWIDYVSLSAYRWLEDEYKLLKTLRTGKLG